MAAGSISAADDSSEAVGATSSYVQTLVCRLCRIFYSFWLEEVDFFKLCDCKVRNIRSFFCHFLLLLKKCVKRVGEGGGITSSLFLLRPLIAELTLLYGGGEGISTFPSSGPTAALRLIIFCM